MNPSPIKAPAVSSQPVAVLQTANNESRKADAFSADQVRVLCLSLDSCGKSIAAAEKHLLNGSVAAVRLAFKDAEKAFEEAQECCGTLAVEELPADVVEKLASLGLRLDRLWVRLVCIFR